MMKTEYIYICEATTRKIKSSAITVRTEVFKDFIDVCEYLKKFRRKQNKKVIGNKELSVYVLGVKENFYHLLTRQEMAECLVKDKSKQDDYMFILHVDKKGYFTVDEMIGDLDKHILELNFDLVEIE